MIQIRVSNENSQMPLQAALVVQVESQENVNGTWVNRVTEQINAKELVLKEIGLGHRVILTGVARVPNDPRVVSDARTQSVPQGALQGTPPQDRRTGVANPQDPRVTQPHDQHEHQSSPPRA